MLASHACRRPRTLAPARALSLAGVALACSLAPAAASAADMAPGCLPAGGLRAADVARSVKPDGGSELTEFTPGGGYRVTRCGRDGRPTVSQTVSPIQGPDGSSVLVPTERQEAGVTVAMLYGDPSDPGWASTFRATRAAVQAQIIPPTVRPATPPVAQPLPPADPGTPGAEEPPKDSGAPATEAGSSTPARGIGATSRRPGGGQVAVAAVAGDACSNPQYSFFQSAWGSRVYGYYVNRSRFSYNDTTVASLVDGHRNWDTTYNSCGLNDITNLTSQHLGSTGETIHTFPDGASVTDKGSLDSICPGALACTWLFTNASGRTTETDQRYNEDFTFSNVGAAGAYDYESISTHETGHSIGLDHANSSNALTMYFQTTAGTTYLRSLAKGDVLGLRARYP